MCEVESDGIREAMRDDDLDNARKIFTEKVGDRVPSAKNINDPFMRDAFTKITSFKGVELFQKRFSQIDKAAEEIKSTAVKDLLDECRSATNRSIVQFRNGQMRSMLLHLVSDVSLCDKMLEKDVAFSQNEERAKALQDMKVMHARCEVYFDKGPIASEAALSLHLYLMGILDKKILAPTHWDQHTASIIEVACAAIAKNFPLFGLIDYINSVRKLSPLKRIQLDLEAGDRSVQYWEAYCKDLTEWIELSVAFQLRLEDSLNSYKEAFSSE